MALQNTTGLEYRHFNRKFTAAPLLLKLCFELLNSIVFLWRDIKKTTLFLCREINMKFNFSIHKEPSRTMEQTPDQTSKPHSKHSSKQLRLRHTTATLGNPKYATHWRQLPHKQQSVQGLQLCMGYQRNKIVSELSGLLTYKANSVNNMLKIPFFSPEM